MKNQLEDKKGIIFGFDDVLYPHKDYLLQVYYLFAEFMAYAEQIDAKKILAFMQREFEEHGSLTIFEKTASEFKIPQKYEQNFNLLHQNARLPLKLLLYQQFLNLLQELVVDRKAIFLLIDGDPVQQLNKIKQIEWHGLEQYLKVYFSYEFKAKPSTESIIFILENNKLQKNEVLLIGKGDVDSDYAANVGIDYLAAEKIF